jgi:hypothetical protein
MAQAKSCFGIFRGNAPHWTLARFCESFGPYPWVRLIGLQEILGTLHLIGAFPTILTLQALVRKELKSAAASIAAEGREFFPKGNWDTCNAAQLHTALAGELMCIEKALLVAHATELACREAVTQYKIPPFDVYKHLSIHASNCIVSGLGEWSACQKYPRRFFKNELRFVDDLEKRIRPRLKQLQMKQQEAETLIPDRSQGFNEGYDLDQFILTVIEGQAVTWKNAQILKTAFEAALQTELKITALTARVNGRLQECSPFETPFVGLTLEELNALRQDLKLTPLSARR